MSLITVDLRDRKALSEQIIDSVKNLILAGDLVCEDKLPSVRVLARELGINPNTIQKAYTELEREGVIITLAGRGSIVAAKREDLTAEQMTKLAQRMQQLADEMALSGISREQFVSQAETAWDKTQNGGNSNDKN